MLSRLTKIMPSKVKVWSTKIEQDTFGEINRIVDCNNLLAYSDSNEKFNIHIDAINLQLEEDIS